MSHELSDEKEMTSYFAKKFARATPVVVVGRSYQSSPSCMAVETLFDNWQDRGPYLFMCTNCSSLAEASVR